MTSVDSRDDDEAREAEAWVAARAPIVGHLELVQTEPWASVFRAPSEAGIVWFKACAPHQAFEVPLTASLSAPTTPGGANSRRRTGCTSRRSRRRSPGSRATTCTNRASCRNSVVPARRGGARRTRPRAPLRARHPERVMTTRRFIIRGHVGPALGHVPTFHVHTAFRENVDERVERLLLEGGQPGHQEHDPIHGREIQEDRVQQCLPLPRLDPLAQIHSKVPSRPNGPVPGHGPD
jgi:hypothetical protein